MSDAGGQPSAALRIHPEHRLPAIAALALAASLFLPWWRDPFIEVTSVAVRRLTFIEVAVFLVAAAVMALVLGRADGRAFHLPLADGTLMAAAGAWAAFLVTFRMLDPPSRTLRRASDGMELTRDYGLRWGAMLALVAALGLAASGIRARRARHHGEREAEAADADAVPTLELGSRALGSRR